MWVVANAGGTKSKSMVVEISPRLLDAPTGCRARLKIYPDRLDR
jgi:hypothetical protein